MAERPGMLSRLWHTVADLGRPAEERVLITPTAPASPAAWLVEALGGLRSKAGASVSEERAGEWPAFFHGLRFLCQTMASLPVGVYRQLEPRGKQLLRHDPLTALILAPNPEMTWFELVELMVSHEINWGNAYAEIVWNNAGQPIELWPLNPDRVRIARNKAGQLVYKVSLPSEQIVGAPVLTKVLAAEDVLHIRGFSRYGILGERLVHLSREAIGLGIASEEFTARFFGDGANASGILSHPGELSELARERLSKSIEEQVGGLERSHRVLILEEGMVWHQTMIDPEKAQLLGLRNFQVTEAARILGVPPHVLYQLERSTNNNIEHQSIELVVYTILPRCVRWEQRMRAQLISTKMQRTVFPKFNLMGLLRGDTQTRFAAYAQATQSGWLCGNDIREFEDLNPVAGLDTFYAPANCQPIPAPTTPVVPDPGNVSADARALVEELLYAQVRPVA